MKNTGAKKWQKEEREIRSSPRLQKKSKPQFSTYDENNNNKNKSKSSTNNIRAQRFPFGIGADEDDKSASALVFLMIAQQISAIFALGEKEEVVAECLKYAINLLFSAPEKIVFTERFMNNVHILSKVVLFYAKFPVVTSYINKFWSALYKRYYIQYELCNTYVVRLLTVRSSSHGIINKQAKDVIFDKTTFPPTVHPLMSSVTPKKSMLAAIDLGNIPNIGIFLMLEPNEVEVYAPVDMDHMRNGEIEDDIDEEAKRYAETSEKTLVQPPSILDKIFQSEQYKQNDPIYLYVADNAEEVSNLRERVKRLEKDVILLKSLVKVDNRQDNAAATTPSSFRSVNNRRKSLSINVPQPVSTPQAALVSSIRKQIKEYEKKCTSPPPVQKLESIFKNL